MAVAAGTPDPAAFRTRMLDAPLPRERRRARLPFLKQLPLVDLSRVASTRYSEDFRTGRLVFSRGGLMAAAIDDRIQAESKGAKSLRDALRHLVDLDGARAPRVLERGTSPGSSATLPAWTSAPSIEEWLRPLR